MNICAAAAEFAYSAPLVTIQLLQAVFSVFALLLFVLNLSVSGLTGQKRFPVHPSLKVGQAPSATRCLNGEDHFAA